MAICWTRHHVIFCEAGRFRDGRLLRCHGRATPGPPAPRAREAIGASPLISSSLSSSLSYLISPCLFSPTAEVLCCGPSGGDGGMAYPIHAARSLRRRCADPRSGTTDSP